MKPTIYKGFTLAEILITLAIIGIVAAMTLPVLGTHIQKRKVETSLKQFYSTMNNALRASSAVNGDPESWIVYQNYTDDEVYEFLKIYILPYIKHNNVIKHCDSFVHWGGSTCVELQNGTGFNLVIDSNGPDILYYVDFNNRNNKYNNSNPQRNMFMFQFAKSGSAHAPHDMITPYAHAWDGTREALVNKNIGYGCKKSQLHQYCTKLIQLNNWKIPNDYPW